MPRLLIIFFYKTDDVLELGESQWAMGHFEDAVKYLSKALAHKESYRDEILKDEALEPLKSHSEFQTLFGSNNANVMRDPEESN